MLLKNHEAVLKIFNVAMSKLASIANIDINMERLHKEIEFINS